MEQYQKVNILLVEDDDIDAMAMNRALKKHKIANPFYRAKDGVEALEMLKEAECKLQRPFIILLDINMPRMNGIEFLQQLRQDNELQDSPVFVLTTSNADEDKVAAFKLNVTGYIVKNKASEGFSNVVELLNSYWRLVELPA